jgi:hypothetical protein
MLRSLLLLLALAAAAQPPPATLLRDGSSPQLALDSRGNVRMIFGRGDTIFSATSHDQGATFAPPEVVGFVRGMHLGNTRGPVVASSRNHSLVAAGDREGDVHLFQLDHRTNAWTRRARTLNTVTRSAPEGLGTLAADTTDTFYAAWLDYRESKQTHIYFARIDAASTVAIANQRIYASPDGHVCECCRPSVAVFGRTVGVMFRNWVDGNRDMYLLMSLDRGSSFAPAEKLGAGSWKLAACPMDGGALVVDGAGGAATVWRRGLDVYFATPGQSELRLGSGRNPMLAQRGGTHYVVWQDGPRVILKTLPQSTEAVVGDGRLPQVLATPDGRAVVAWENDGRVYFRKM